jgi:hypothetical protein
MLHCNFAVFYTIYFREFNGNPLYMWQHRHTEY